jgi:hypothetical protein
VVACKRLYDVYDDVVPLESLLFQPSVAGLLQPHARPSAVFVDELDACRLKYPMQP